MDELTHLIMNSHQVFMGLLVLAFSFYFIQDMHTKKTMGINNRRFIVAFLLFFTGGVFSLFYSEWGQQGLFLAFEFSLLVTFTIIHPKYAVGFLVFLFISRPWETYTDQMMSSVPRDMSYLAIISLCAHKLIKKEYYFRFNLGTFLICGFSVWVLLSGFFSNHSDEAILKYVEVFSKGIILFLLIQNGLNESKDMLPLKAGFVLAILEKCFVSFYKSNYIELPTILEDANERLESVGILANSNDIAAIFVLAIPFTIFFILKSKLKPLSWLIAFGTFLIMALLVWQSASRGALLGIFAIFGAYALLKIKSKKMLILAGIFAMVGVMGSFALMNRDAEDLEGSTSNRLIYWKAGLNMAVRNPVFGVGFWGFPKNLPAYVVDGNVGSEKEHMTAHSSWVLVLGENGFMALFLFGSLWIYAAYAAWKIRESQPEYFLGIAGYGMAITFLSHTYLLFPYILLALVITHYQINNSLVPNRELI